MKKEEDASVFIIPERFDLMAKYIYALHVKLNVKSDFHKRLYNQHIKVFNGGWEYPGTKTQLEDFEFCFNEILKSIAERQFDPSISVIPVGKNNIPINGLHRIAASLVYNSPLYIQPKYKRLGTIYDYKWFRNHRTHVPEGLTYEWSDPMALTYATLKPNTTRMLIVFPSAQLNAKTQLQLEDKILETNKIVYYKPVQLNARGLMNLLIECYYEEKWIGHNYECAEGKFKLCLGNDMTIHVYLIEPGNVELVPLFKKRARQLFSAGQDSLHINDTGEQTIRLARALFNHNSIHYLNYAKYRTEFTKWSKNRFLFDVYKAWTEKQSEELQEQFAIDGSFVMALYGLREAADLDFIHFDDTYSNDLREIGIHSHNNEIKKFQDKHLHELLFDPANYLYIHGVKCITLNLLKNMKLIRNEPKDRMDILLINKIL